MKSDRIEILCGSLTLEGLAAYPQGTGPFALIVICHPHSLYGGSMYNHVIEAVAQKAIQKGLASLRFNFRGVGRSGGRFGDGIGEQEDLRAVLSYAEDLKTIDRKKSGSVDIPSEVGWLWPWPRKIRESPRSRPSRPSSNPPTFWTAIDDPNFSSREATMNGWTLCVLRPRWRVFPNRKNASFSQGWTIFGSGRWRPWPIESFNSFWTISQKPHRGIRRKGPR
jgi:hypothetical protein